jgi:hypothetical protein
MDDTDGVVVATFFFTTDGKLFVPTFNYSIRNMSKCRTSRLLIHLNLQASFFIVRHDFIDGVLHMGGSSKGECSGTSNDTVAALSGCAICDVFVS